MKHLIAAAATTLTLVSAQAADLALRIDDVKSADGTVSVALYNSADSFLKKPAHYTRAKAEKGTVTVDFKDLPEGEYAVALYHDANANGKMDKNMIGMPTEDFAFSNNAMGKMGPPSFEQAKLAVPAAGLAATVSLK